MGEWKPKDKCGVVGVVRDGPVAPLIYHGLRAIQHRGQESAGIATFNGRVRSEKGMGLVEHVFSSDKLEALEGSVGVGHVRYSTTGSSKVENAQPMVATSSEGAVALGHNGDVVNSGAIREELEANGWGFLTESDTEVIVRLLAKELADASTVVRAIRNTMKRLEGSYSLVFTLGDRLFAVRDPLAIKPLCLGELRTGGYAVASESTAFNAMDGHLVRDVAAGEIVEVTREGFVSHGAKAHEAKAHCQFEYVYFAQADSVMDGREVYDVRMDIGARLAKESPVEADIVVPVPDSGRTHALGFSRATGIPFAEGLMKNRYAHRTFIMPDQQDRALGVKVKLSPVHSVLEGRRVVLVDDSIVRGTTMGRIVQMVRDAGAAEVHVRIGSPPIKAPCYLGIDMNTRQELVAAKRSVDEINEVIGADSLAYLTVDGLVDSIGLQGRDLCMGCLTGEYPVEVPGERHRLQKTLF